MLSKHAVLVLALSMESQATLHRSICFSMHTVDFRSSVVAIVGFLLFVCFPKNKHIYSTKIIGTSDEAHLHKSASQL